MADFAVIDETVLDGLGMRGPMSTNDWSERHRIVKGGPVADQNPSGRVPWRTHVMPHARGIMDAVDDPLYQTVVVEGCTRLAKTEAAIINPILHEISKGRTVLYTNSTREACVGMWQDKLLPAIESSPGLGRFDIGDKEKGQMMHRVFPNGAVLYMAGAGQIPAGFDAAKQFCDEVNKPGYDRKKGDEVDTINLARERGSGYERGRKLVLVCTVTTPSGRITTWYLSGDQRLYYVPCPFCGGWQVMEFAKNHESFLSGERYPDWDYPHGWVEYDDANELVARESAAYVCGHCERQIPAAYKTWMVRAGLWVRKGCGVRTERVRSKKSDSAKGRPVQERPIKNSKLPARFIAYEDGTPETDGATASFHFNAVLSIINSWGDLAQQYVAARDADDPEVLISFQRSRLAIPHQDQDVLDVRSWDSRFIRSHATPYYPMTLPPDCPAEHIVMGADVHAAAIYYVFRAFAKDGTSWLLEAGVEAVHHMKNAGDDARRLAILNALERLWAAFDHGFNAGDEDSPKPMSVNRGFLDEGWETDVVRAACRTTETLGRWYAVKGAPGMDKKLRERQKDVKTSWNIRVDRYKHMLVRLLERRRWEEENRERIEPGYWHLHAEPGHDYIKHMCSEEWRPKKNRSGADVEDYEWGLRAGHNNHWWDCEVYALAAAHSIGINIPKIAGGAEPGSAPAPARPSGEPRKPTAADYGDRKWSIGRNGGGEHGAGRPGGWKIGR